MLQRAILLMGLLGALLILSSHGAAAQGQDPVIQHTAPHWTGTYFNNATLSAPAAFVREDRELNFNWGTGSPQPGTLNSDFFSVRWERYIDVTPGTYRFTAVSDDGVRVSVDGVRIIDRWYEHPPETYTADLALGPGHHLVVVEYFELRSGAQISVNWAPVGPPPSSSAFRGEYYANRDLSGTPIAVREDPRINFDWGNSSPFPSSFTDSFSARWTRTVAFEPGSYRFFVTADDGVRLWVNNHLLIDQWREQSATTFSGDIYLSGAAEVKMEYYEAVGSAVAKLNWERTPGSLPPPGPEQSVIYLVQRGDTLSSIARRFGTTVDAIMLANRLSSTNIYPYQRLIIPVRQGPPPAPPAPAPLPTPIPGELLVDDGGPGFALGGSPSGWQTSSVGHGGRMTWALNNQVEQPNYNWARWSPNLQPGRYEVFVFIPSRNAGTTNATYWVTYADGSVARRVNQAVYSNAWVSLGTYYFSGAPTESVSLTDITGEPALSRRVGFDAMKWVPR